MDRKFWVILLACVICSGILFQPTEAMAGKYATAKPSFNKYNHNTTSTYRNTGTWLDSIKAKYFDFKFSCFFDYNFPFSGWLLIRNKTSDYSSQHIVKTILDYEDYTHVYITYESKE